MSKILVVGSRGNVGSKLARLLLEKNEKVKAATSEKNVTVAGGTETVYLDLRVPSSFQNALDGVDRLYLMSPTGQLDLIDAIKAFIQAAAMKKIKVVLQTAMGVDSDDGIPIRQVEIMLEKSGTPFVVLRPNWFMDNFHNYWRESIRRDGIIAVPAADSRTSFIDTMDIAACAVSVMESDSFNGRAFNITGPAAYSYAEAAAIISGITGKTVNYKNISGEEFVQSMVKAGVTEDYAKFLAGLFIPVTLGYSGVITGTVKEITGRDPGTLEEYIKAHTSSWL